MSAKKNTAVVVVDMQQAFLDEFTLTERVRLVDNHFDLLEHCKTRDVPVVGLRYGIYGDYYPRLEFKIDEVPRHRHIWKDSNDGFSNPALKEYLEELSIDRLCITGINAAFCVKSTTRSALDKGFQVATSDDLIGNAIKLKHTPYRDWFKESTTWFNRYQDMLRTL
ncbi:MAG: isochorismatase family cysteine hydrolase [Nanoarchaeota archaeon]